MIAGTPATFNPKFETTAKNRWVQILSGHALRQKASVFGCRVPTGTV